MQAAMREEKMGSERSAGSLMFHSSQKVEPDWPGTQWASLPSSPSPTPPVASPVLGVGEGPSLGTVPWGQTLSLESAVASQGRRLLGERWPQGPPNPGWPRPALPPISSAQGS